MWTPPCPQLLYHNFRISVVGLSDLCYNLLVKMSGRWRLFSFIVPIWDLLSPLFVWFIFHNTCPGYQVCGLVLFYISVQNRMDYSLLWSFQLASTISGLHFSRPLDGADIQIGSDLDNLAYWCKTFKMLILEIKAMSPPRLIVKISILWVRMILLTI